MIVNIISVETVQEPGKKWAKKVVTYDSNGSVRKQNLMSFGNPTLYKEVNNYIGESVDVEVGKNEKGYDEWRSVKPAAAGASSPSKPAYSPAPNRTFETPEERAQKQVWIIRQSSLAQAVASVGPGKKLEDYFERAEAFTNWVMATTTEEDDGPTE